MFIKHILKNDNHPIVIISNIFKKHFDLSYNQYISPNSNKQTDKDMLFAIHKQKSKVLKDEFMKRQESENELEFRETLTIEQIEEEANK